MKKITRKTIIKSIRTFIQAFVGSFISAGAIVGWTDTDIKNSLLGCLLTAIFAGLTATCMNLENKGDVENEL